MTVCREFGLADNGDFSRYMTPYCTMPVGMQENWPTLGSEEWHRRFFSQPIFYWKSAEYQQGNAWFSSAHVFWSLGYSLNKMLFDADVLNLKILGLPLLTVQIIAFVIAVYAISSGKALLLPLMIPMIALFTDARIISFYNSFYAEAVAIVAVFFGVGYFLRNISANSPAHVSCGQGRLFAVAAFILFIAAALSKRQYIYFIIPAAIIVLYSLHSVYGVRWKKALVLSSGTLLLIAIALGSVMKSERHGDPDELFASRVTSYHALYYGLLMQEEDPQDLLFRLGLPKESLSAIGSTAWSEVGSKIVSSADAPSVVTFLKAISLSPLSFGKSVWHNAQQVGNWDFGLGMVHGRTSADPPVIVSSLTSLSTKLPAGLVLSLAVVGAIWLFFAPLGDSPHERLSSRFLTSILAAVLCFDVVVSAFDGRQEIRKHLVIASLCAAVIAILAFASLVSVLRFAWKKKLEPRMAATTDGHQT
jgi:hypothetical protein